jgi:hypothetical protein
MTTKLRAEGMNLKGVPSVIVVMGRWHPDGIGQGGEAEILGVFGGEDRKEKATARCKEALSGEDARAEVWLAGDFFVQ